MSNAEAGAAATPNYGATPPSTSAKSKLADAPGSRAKTGFAFLGTLYGVLDIIILISLICVIICAAAANAENCKDADKYPKYTTTIRLSAYSTRGAVLAFVIIGLIFIVVDILLHVTKLINRFSTGFDKVFIIIMFVLAGVYLILGGCAAAWEQKMQDTVGRSGAYKHKGSAGAASFFLFATMLLVLANFILRLIRSGSNNETA